MQQPQGGSAGMGLLTPVKGSQQPVVQPHSPAVISLLSSTLQRTSVIKSVGTVVDERRSLEELIRVTYKQPPLDAAVRTVDASRQVCRDPARFSPGNIIQNTVRASPNGGPREDKPEEDMAISRQTTDPALVGDELRSWRKCVHSKGFDLMRAADIVGMDVAFHLDDQYDLFTVHSKAPTEQGQPKDCYIVFRSEPAGAKFLCIQLSPAKRMEFPADLKNPSKNNWATVERCFGESVPRVPLLQPSSSDSVAVEHGSWKCTIVNAGYVPCSRELVPFVALGGLADRDVAFKIKNLGWTVLHVLKKSKNRDKAKLNIYDTLTASGDHQDLQLVVDRYLPLDLFRTDDKGADGAEDESWILLEGPIGLHSGHAVPSGSAGTEYPENLLTSKAVNPRGTSGLSFLAHRKEETEQTMSRAKEEDIRRREQALVEKERHVREVIGLFNIEQRDLLACIRVKTEKLEGSDRHAAQIEQALQTKNSELVRLKAFAKEQIREIKDMRAKIASIEDGMECMICMERPAGSALIPCGHCFCCQPGCASLENQVCPVCMAAVENRTTVFAASASELDIENLWQQISALAATLSDLDSERQAAHVTEEGTEPSIALPIGGKQCELREEASSIALSVADLGTDVGFPQDLAMDGGDKRDDSLCVREARLASKEKELARLEAVVAVRREALEASITAKRDRLNERCRTTAAMAAAVRSSRRELSALRGSAAAQVSRLEALHSKIRELMASRECTVCGDNEAATALAPCGHCFCCRPGCASFAARTCASCGDTWQSKTRLFASMSCDLSEDTHAVRQQLQGALSSAAQEAQRGQRAEDEMVVVVNSEEEEEEKEDENVIVDEGGGKDSMLVDATAGGGADREEAGREEGGGRECEARAVRDGEGGGEEVVAQSSDAEGAPRLYRTAGPAHVSHEGGAEAEDGQIKDGAVEMGAEKKRRGGEEEEEEEEEAVVAAAERKRKKEIGNGEGGEEGGGVDVSLPPSLQPPCFAPGEQERPRKRGKVAAGGSDAVPWWLACSALDGHSRGELDGQSFKLDEMQQCFEFELAGFLARAWTGAGTMGTGSTDQRKLQALRNCTFLRNYLSVPGMEERVERVVQSLAGSATAIRDASIRSSQPGSASNGGSSCSESLRDVIVERLQEMITVPRPRKAAGSLLRVTLPFFPALGQSAPPPGDAFGPSILKKLNLSSSQAHLVDSALRQWWTATVQPFVLRAESAISEHDVRRVLGLEAIRVDPAQPHALEMSLSGGGNYCSITVPSDASVDQVVHWLEERLPLFSERDGTEGVDGWPYLDVVCRARRPDWYKVYKRSGEMHTVNFCDEHMENDAGGSDSDGQDEASADIDRSEIASLVEWLESFREGGPRGHKQFGIERSGGACGVNAAEFSIASAVSILIEAPPPTLAQHFAKQEEEAAEMAAKGPESERKCEEGTARDSLQVRFRWSESGPEYSVGAVRRVPLPLPRLIPVFRKSR